MNQHEHQHKHHGHEHDQHHRPRRGLHKHWLTWVVVGLMLGAMVIYIFTMDESIRPGSTIQGPGMPAAPSPPAGI